MWQVWFSVRAYTQVAPLGQVQEAGDWCFSLFQINNNNKKFKVPLLALPFTAWLTGEHCKILCEFLLIPMSLFPTQFLCHYKRHYQHHCGFLKRDAWSYSMKAKPQLSTSTQYHPGISSLVEVSFLLLNNLLINLLPQICSSKCQTFHLFIQALKWGCHNYLWHLLLK